MQVKIIVTGIGLAVSFIVATHIFAGEYQLEVFALFLALTSCVYGGAILTPAGAKYSYVEFPFVATVFVASILGLIFHPLWLSAGYLLHGCWDAMHHFKKVNTPIVKWFPPLCAIFDILLALFILWIWYAGT